MGQALVPNQYPKGDVVGSRLPSLWASIPLFAREGQVVNDLCDSSLHIHHVSALPMRKWLG